MNIFCKTAVCIALTTLASGQLLAADEPGDLNFSVFVTGAKPDDDRLVNDGGGAGVSLGRVLHKYWNIEGTFGFLNFNADDDKNGINQDQIYLTGNALNIYNRDGRFQPYILGGIGIVQTRM